MSNVQLARQLRNVPKLQQSLKTKSESYWTDRGENMALNLFHDMAKRVPAYKDFLKQNSINPKLIRNVKDFKQLPLIDKDNYLRQYPREALCWDGKFAERQWVISTTSGSTGEPFYFPRTNLQNDYYALTAELYLRENFQIQHKKTLYIDAFAMGAWIGGLFTYDAIKHVADKGYKLSIITPGINKAEVINSVRKLGSDFDQVIIGSYPPLLRDIIDLGIESGLDWGKYKLGIVFSAESFGEEFRDHIIDHAKLANVYTSTLNHYGTVDMGTMSHETPISILVRRQAVNDRNLFKELFGEIRKQPTLTQYLPELHYFESVDERVICSSYSGIPLVRYDLKDHGGVLSLEQIVNAYKVNNKNLYTELEAAKLSRGIWNLPFAYVYERSDFSVKLVGGVIHTEEIRRALLTDPLHSKLTGKFNMEVLQTSELKSKLVLQVELKNNVKGDDSLGSLVQKIITAVLLKDNTEYQSNYAVYGEELMPTINLWPFAHELYFSGKGKQSWVKK